MYDTSPPPNEFLPITTVYLERCKRGKTLIICSDSCFSTIIFKLFKIFKTK